MRRPPTLPLFWRVVIVNAAVFCAGVVALVVSPATISQRLLLSEAWVLGAGLAVLLVTNALLLRRILAPLDRLAATMAQIESPMPGQPLPQQGHGVVGDLVASFNAMLRRLEAERTSSSARALAAQESERQRIAQELHDEIGQNLTVVLLGLKRAADQAPPGLADDLRAIQATARTSLEEVRQVARRLRPGVLQDLGLVSALSALASDIDNHSELRVRRGFAPGLPALDEEAELVVYRVAQEALTNASRHANATCLDLSLSRQGDSVVLRVGDDGRGIRGAREGAGITGMRERAALVGGRLDVGPADGGGTEVRLLVPVRSTPA